MFKRQLREIFIGFFYDCLFSILPTERWLLLSLWHRSQYYKLIRPFQPANWVLDDTLVSMELRLAMRGLSKERLLIYRRLNYASQDATLLGAVIGFLESESIERSLLNELARRLEAVTRFGPLGDQVTVLDENEPDGGGGEVVAVEKPRVLEKKAFHAKTYFIAAHLHFELAADEPEYMRLSVQPKELADFVRRQFGEGELPGTFYSLKGYSYKSILAGKNSSQKGQLRPCFNQIASHPEVFGPEVAKKAQSILLEHFD